MRKHLVHAWELKEVNNWLATADRILSGPPTRPHTVRPTPRGQLVARFALPLELCLTTNRTRGAAFWKQGNIKTKIKKLMDLQEVATRRRFRCPAPLAGRPQVFCVRFDSHETDALADWAKAPVDYLTRDSQRTDHKTGMVHHIRRLGYLHDDAPKWIELVCWQEYVKHEDGFVYVAIFSEHSWDGAGKDITGCDV